MKIWALFSIANAYDQPQFNLEAWWSERPTFAILADALGITVDPAKGNSSVGQVLQGREVRISQWDYRLEEIEEGDYQKN